MDLLQPFKKFGKKVKKQMDKVKDKEGQDKLAMWVKRFESAKAQTNPDSFDEREALVLGSRMVDKNINSGDTPKKGANNIYNICFEFIESQVNSQIPQPNVRGKRQGLEEQSKMIEDSITNDLKENGIEQVNDYNERMTPMHGYSVMVLDWDSGYEHHLYRGIDKVSAKHPKQIIPQPGVYDIQCMDYFFVVSGVTKEYVKRRYDVDVEDNKQQYPEYNTLNGNANTRVPSPKGLTATGSNTNMGSDVVTEIVAFYRDKDGDIGKFVWVDTIVCEDLPKLFYRRMMECKECGHMNPMGTDECMQCDSKKLTMKTVHMQTLDRDVTISNGEVLPMGTEIPYYTPTKYPVIIRKNVPKSFAFEGQSDVDMIRDQQDSIKKIGTKMEEKVLKSGYLVTLPSDLKQQITTETMQVIKLENPAQLSMIQSISLQPDINRDIQFLDQQRMMAQQMLGITNSFQGLTDVSANSGRAKQIQVQQAAGRLQSKVFNKITAYKELFHSMFEFRLAFYDEPRPYIAKDVNGQTVYGEFDKYKFLMRDAAGELYYCTDFVFSADSGDGLPKDPMFMYEQASIQRQQGLIDDVQYWTILESLNYPNAAQFKDQAMQKQQEALQAPPPPTPEQEKLQGELQKQEQKHVFDMQKQQEQQKFELVKMDVGHDQELQKGGLQFLGQQATQPIGD